MEVCEDSSTQYGVSEKFNISFSAKSAYRTLQQSGDELCNKAGYALISEWNNTSRN
jgi:hypothetical protein